MQASTYRMVCLTEAPSALPKRELCVVVYYCLIRIIGREGWRVRGEGFESRSPPYFFKAPVGQYLETDDDSFLLQSS
jgi:hypothetical protein